MSSKKLKFSQIEMLPHNFSSKAVIRPRPDPTAWIRLFTFPPAGYGATFYYSWASLLQPGIELNNVQLPGRENRLRDKSCTTMQDLVNRLDVDLQPELGRPFAFFGHSMGAWIAYELARRFGELGHQPVYLFVSGRQPPGTPDPLPPIHLLPEAAFVSELQRRYRGIPAAVLSDPEFLALFLPILRADVTILETYTSSSFQPLDIPIAAFYGEDDKTLSPESMTGWQDHTRGLFAMRAFTGDHFYLQQPGLVVATIIESLQALRYGDL